jgi:hypothetical protein
MKDSLCLLREFIKCSGLNLDRIDYLIRLAETPTKGIYRLDSGLVLDYSPTSPATITVKWAPEGSGHNKGDQVMQGEEGFNPLFDSIRSVKNRD